MRSLRQIPTRPRGINFCIKCTSSACFAHEFRVLWVESGVLNAKNSNNFEARTFALIAPIQPILRRVSYNNKMAPNAPKHYGIQQNMSLGSIGGGSSAFFANNSDMNSWHELLH